MIGALHLLGLQWDLLVLYLPVVQVHQGYHGDHPSQYFQDHPTKIEIVQFAFPDTLHISTMFPTQHTMHSQQDPFLLSAPAILLNLGDREDQAYRLTLVDQVHLG